MSVKHYLHFMFVSVDAAAFQIAICGLDFGLPAQGGAF